MSYTNNLSLCVVVRLIARGTEQYLRLFRNGMKLNTREPLRDVPHCARTNLNTRMEDVLCGCSQLGIRFTRNEAGGTTLETIIIVDSASLM